MNNKYFEFVTYIICNSGNSGKCEVIKSVFSLFFIWIVLNIYNIYMSFRFKVSNININK